MDGFISNINVILSEQLLCPIDEEEYDSSDKKPVMLFPCGHTICQVCYSSLSNTICPFCRLEFITMVTNFELLKIMDSNNKIKSILKDLNKSMVETVDKLKKEIQHYKLESSSHKKDANSSLESPLEASVSQMNSIQPNIEPSAPKRESFVSSSSDEDYSAFEVN